MVVLFGRSSPDLTELSWLCAGAGFFTTPPSSACMPLCTGVPNTRARHGTGFAIGLGRGGSVLGPIAAGYLFKWGYTLPTVATYMALGSLLAAGILALLPLKPAQPASITLLSKANS